MKTKFVKFICWAVIILAGFYMLGLAGTSDHADAVGDTSYDFSWFLLRGLAAGIAIILAVVVYYLMEKVECMSYTTLEVLESSDKNPLYVECYRFILKIFH